MFETLYHVSERTQVDFIGAASENARYDLAIVYTRNFFDKPIVICLQTGKSLPLSQEDLQEDLIARTFRLKPAEAAEICMLLHEKLPLMSSREQYA
ncbi:SAV0927 family protein [Marinicrinis sediminis]|uniref:SAV0927 family protein n=1 Tax=Marinicrinis sediminis TaxID=1652465 RepID=A0ABW5R670_9BACL